jgi:hypothetical protein
MPHQNFYPTKTIKKPYSSIMNRFTTPPVLKAHEFEKHHPTLNKAKIQGVVEFCEKMKIPYHKEDVFRTFNVPRETEYRILRSGFSARRIHNRPDHVKTKDRKSVISSIKIREMKKLLKEEEIEARDLT